MATNSGAMTKVLAFLAAAVCFFWLSGCGSKSTNTVVVTVTSSAGTSLLVGQSTTLTAIVTGATNTNVNWQPCQFTTTTVSGTTTTTTKPASCPTDGSLGTISNQQTTGTATYTAPSKIPDQTKFPGLQIVITAQSQQSTVKTGSVTLILNSGIGVPLNPTTATVATKEPFTFTATLTNDLQMQGVVWLVTQATPTATITAPNLASCSPGCGTITSNGLYTGVYTAPATIPTSTTTTSTPAIVTVVATAKADNTRFATGTITIIQGGPITFNGISPTIAPQGAALWDIYLDAPNMSSASSITLTQQNCQTGCSKTFNSSTGQIKVLFPIPTSTTANPGPTGVRLRLLEADLGAVNTTNSSAPLTYTFSVSDPGEPVTKAAGGNFTLTLMPVRPTVVASSPNGVVQGASTLNFPLVIDGGYFGSGGTLANVLFEGNQIPFAKNSQGQPLSNSRQLALQFPTNGINSTSPGLYPLSTSRTTPPPPPNASNAAVTTLAVFPDYSTTPPQVVGSPIAAGTNPSAIDIDQTLGILVVAETGSNAIKFYTIGSGTLSPLGAPVPVGQIPTGVSVNQTNHSVAVVNYGSQSVSIVPIPGVPNPVARTDVSLSGLLQGVSPAPLPYAIGVDPDTNLALVAYSSTSTSTAANLGFVVNLNQGANAPFGCLANSGKTPPCVFSQVTLNTGAYPQIAMAPHGHMAYVSPGGSGVVRGVDVTQSSTSVGISSLSLAVGVVTVTTSNTLTGTIPGMPFTVLISGVPTSNSAGNTNFNGVFSATVTSSTTFIYSLTGNNNSGTASGGTVFYGSPNVIFPGISATTQGIAINPITQTAALADANATGQNGPQIDLLNQLDQSVSSISYFATCTAFTINCAGSPELLHTADVAWQPYTNLLVSYNPTLNQVSISDPETRTRRALACKSSSACQVNPIVPSQVTLTGTGTATINSLTLWGGIAVDSATNQAFIVQSGSSTIQIVNLGSFKASEITEVVVPSPSPGPGVIGGIPKALVPQATLTSAIDLPGVQIFGSGFDTNTQVRLDGTGFASTVLGNFTFVSSRQITVTVPHSFLSTPHHYALDVINGSNVQSNASDFIVIQAVDMTSVCSSHNPQPSAVAIADQLKNGPFSPIAVIANSNCNNISTIDINPASATFGHILHTIAVGTTPQGVAVSQRLGLAVVANNGSGNASIVNLLTNTQPVPAVTTGTNPAGVAINEATNAAIVANFNSNNVSVINLGLLTGSSSATSLTASNVSGVQEPIAIAIDPDRGTNNQGLAVVTGLQLLNGSAPNGALYPVDIGLATPVLSTTIPIGNVSTSPTGIVFDPAVSTPTQNPGVFYVNSSGTNQISSFNPDNNASSFVNVGINPTSLALNPQTGAILTANAGSRTVSVVDTLSNPFRTRQTLGLPGSPQFGVAIDQFTNLAVVVDPANNRVFLYPMPN